MLQATNLASWFLLIGSSSLLLILIFFFLLFFQYHKRQLHHTNELHRVKQAYDQALMQSQLEIQEQTFKVIAQEIHDNIGQMLTLAKLNLNTLNLEQQEKAQVKVTDAKELVGKAIQDLRDLSRTLNTDHIAALGLMRAIDNELQLLQKSGVVQTDMEVTGTVVKSDPQKELILFRIVQEAIHNVIKHAQATTVAVRAAYEGNLLKLSIADNGVGFEGGDGRANGSGLTNMRSRSQVIGAQLQIDSRSGKGTNITIQLPINT
jgi:two-component system, NarL family, sensor kinase